MESPQLIMRLILIALMLLISPLALARDDGRYADSPLKAWFDSLRSSKGFCCSEADGHETEYDVREGQYWVPVGEGQWIPVPEDTILTEPNKLGRAIVWFMTATDGGTPVIRCFLPASGA
jgi:hypothetical protein